MSVYIKGMEMPTVRDTLVLVRTNGTAIVYEDEAYVTTVVPVPEHGRLIDADALIRNQPYYSLPKQRIVDAPTIIPASGGKENE